MEIQAAGDDDSTIEDDGTEDTSFTNTPTGQGVIAVVGMVVMGMMGAVGKKLCGGKKKKKAGESGDSEESKGKQEKKKKEDDAESTQEDVEGVRSRNTPQGVSAWSR